MASERFGGGPLWRRRPALGCSANEKKKKVDICLLRSVKSITENDSGNVRTSCSVNCGRKTGDKSCAERDSTIRYFLREGDFLLNLSTSRE